MNNIQFRELIHYQMPKAMADDLLSTRNKAEMKIDPQKYLCDYVNDQLGLLGHCVHVVVK